MGINLGEIEWYHRLRNQLYHQGNGLTVERDKVEVYAELANLLFANLFDHHLILGEDRDASFLGDFLSAWVNFELVISAIYTVNSKKENKHPVSMNQMIQFLKERGILSKTELEEIHELRILRNDLVHGHANYKDKLDQNTINRLIDLINELKRF